MFVVLLSRAICLLLLLILESLATVDMVIEGFLLEGTGALRWVIIGFRVLLSPVVKLTLLCALARLRFRFREQCFILPAGFDVYHSRPARSVAILGLLDIDDGVVLGIQDECPDDLVSGYFGSYLFGQSQSGWTLIEGDSHPPLS